MQLLYKIIGDLIVLFHLAWILFLIFGALIGCRIRGLMWLHLGGLGFSILLQVFSAPCPLTTLEVWVHERHDPQLAYPGSFIAHYAEELVYLQADPDLLFWLTIGLVLINLVIYGRAQIRGLREHF